jgi:hypothetical protein
LGSRVKHYLYLQQIRTDGGIAAVPLDVTAPASLPPDITWTSMIFWPMRGGAKPISPNEALTATRPRRIRPERGMPVKACSASGVVSTSRKSQHCSCWPSARAPPPDPVAAFSRGSSTVCRTDPHNVLAFLALLTILTSRLARRRAA